RAPARAALWLCRAPRARLLRTAVGSALVPPTEPELRLLHQRLDSWRGIGDVVRGVDVQLTEYDPSAGARPSSSPFRRTPSSAGTVQERRRSRAGGQG